MYQPISSSHSQGLPSDKTTFTPLPASSSVPYSPPSQPTASFLVDGPHDSIALTISVTFNIVLSLLVVVGITWLYLRGRQKGKARTFERTSTDAKIATRPPSDPGTIDTASLPPLEQRITRLTDCQTLSTDATLFSNMCVVQTSTDDGSLSSTSGASGMARRTEKWHAFIYGDIRSP